MLVDNYTRVQARADGVLTDVTDQAKAAGFKLPVALTIGALEATAHVDLQHLLERAARAASGGGREVSFEVGGVALRAAVGPGDAGEPVCTIFTLSEA